MGSERGLKSFTGLGVYLSFGSGALPRHCHPWTLRCRGQGPAIRETPGNWRLQKIFDYLP